MSTLEQELEQRIARAISSWQKQVTEPGQPLEVDDAWLQTPEPLRMGFRVLKNAGIPPQEVELFQQRAALQAALDAAVDADTRLRLQRQLAGLEQKLAFRLEALRRMAGR
ncbi:DUF1992 domain-containing protein [Azomonas macrocytogenes]|uniref:DUF1992 domain-containing protein n=1 Tax=Azomonas macrocytogenes TaxID=69962 RepID=A0A839T2N9_AZOMA|nr:DUF1992 domain-containing protein [Azomonas macrocytogenes]MBB3102920.1 hypothetical protein [Azomonas macrocytogenes]